jgi:hypothetical protein
MAFPLLTRYTTACEEGEALAILRLFFYMKILQGPVVLAFVR